MKHVVEIGGGIRPYFLRYEITPEVDSIYTCIDIYERNLKRSREALVSHRESGNPAPQDSQFVLADAISLPLPDACADTVVLSNVLSAPIHYNWNKEGTKVTYVNDDAVYSRPIVGNKKDGDPFLRERIPVVREALRVLKPGGELVVYTDLVIYGEHSYNTLLDMLQEEEGMDTYKDTQEEARIDAMNNRRCYDGNNCYCFNAEVLPRSSVLRFRKITY